MFKDAKTGGQKFAILNTTLAAASMTHPEPEFHDADTTETRANQETETS